jgi:hypothetical protein
MRMSFSPIHGEYPVLPTESDSVWVDTRPCSLKDHTSELDFMTRLLHADSATVNGGYNGMSLSCYLCSLVIDSINRLSQHPSFSGS